MYCVKCRKQTETGNIKVEKTKNNRFRAVGKCAICSTKKSKFISKKEGQGLIGNLVGNPNLLPQSIKNIPILGQLLGTII